MDVSLLSTILIHAPQIRLQNYLPFLQASMEYAEINTPARIAMYMAQIAHESGEFRYLEEIWGPTSAQKRYEPPSDLAVRLGNTEPGDSLKFKGRGVIQLTGRANYDRAGKALGIDLLGTPAIAARPDLAFKLAAWFWSTHNLNTYADQLDLEGCTRKINGGLNGLDDRRSYYIRACKALGVSLTTV
jgi:putative chitinase